MIKDLAAYKRLEKEFAEKGYRRGIRDRMPIYYWRDTRETPPDLTPGHYVCAHSYASIRFRDIPEQFLTREFFLHALSGSDGELVDYVKSHPERFDRQFYKDHIETNEYSLEFELNDFEYMPLDFIDEELVMCAMFAAIDHRSIDRRDEMDKWFYSVHKRKPEVLTEELYILGARCFASRRRDKNEFLEITPEEYRTSEYYYALCSHNDTPVMMDVPENEITDLFISKLLCESTENIQCFTEDALERVMPFIEIPGHEGEPAKVWQVAIKMDGYCIRDIPLNDERAEYFMSLYDKDSSEYEISFKDHYRRYLRSKKAEKNQSSMAACATKVALSEAISGTKNDSALDIGNAVAQMMVDRKNMIPIRCEQDVPVELRKKLDKEEYLLAIYEKLGIHVLDEVEDLFYNVELPENLTIAEDENGYSIRRGDKPVIHYCDMGPFWDREVYVDKIFVTL